MINAFDLIRRPPGNGLCFFAQYFFLGSGSQPPLNGSRQNWRISLKCTVLLTIKNNWGRCRSHHIVPFVQKNCWTYDQKKLSNRYVIYPRISSICLIFISTGRVGAQTTIVLSGTCVTAFTMYKLICTDVESDIAFLSINARNAYCRLWCGCFHHNQVQMNGIERSDQCAIWRIKSHNRQLTKTALS